MRQPALALLELDSVAAGIRTADIMVKRAPIALLKAGTVQPGRFLVMVGGSVASVEEAFFAGTEAAGNFLADSVFLPDVDGGVYDAALGARKVLEQEALGVFETLFVASLLRAADAAVKGAAVGAVEIRIADGLGGRAFVLFDGLVADVEAALDIAASRVAADRIVAATIMPRLDGSLRRALASGTRFAPCEPLQPDGAELPEGCEFSDGGELSEVIDVSR
jgi:microcompartment protein CcmL/EutN